MGDYYQEFLKYPVKIFIFWTYNLFSKEHIVKMFYLFAVVSVNFVFKNKIATAFKSSSPEVFTEIMFEEILQNYTKNLCWSHLFHKVAGWWRPTTLLSKTPTQVLCPELCKILKNTFFAKTSANSFFVFSWRSVPIPKIITKDVEWSVWM